MGLAIPLALLSLPDMCFPTNLLLIFSPATLPAKPNLPGMSSGRASKLVVVAGIQGFSGMKTSLQSNRPRSSTSARCTFRANTSYRITSKHICGTILRLPTLASIQPDGTSSSETTSPPCSCGPRPRCSRSLPMPR
jgi:hypothetical protein